MTYTVVPKAISGVGSLQGVDVRGGQESHILSRQHLDPFQMAQSSEFSTGPCANSNPVASSLDDSFQHTTDENIPLTKAEVYDSEQQAAGSYNMQYPEPPPSYLQSEGAFKQTPCPSPGTNTNPPSTPYVVNTQQPNYPIQQPYPIAVAAPPPVSVIPVVQPQPTVVVVGSQALAPGICTVCRRGKIKKSPSCCSWICCILLLPFFIFPGLIALCCCCQKPKCSHCRYSP